MNPKGAVSLLLVALACVAVLAPAAASAAERTVAVGGEATVRVANDSARLGFSVSVVRSKRSLALKAVAGGLRRVIAAVQGTSGVGEGDVTTGQISVGRLSRPGRDVFRASEGISVVLHQPDAAGELVADAIAAGATGTRGPTFFVGSTSTAYAGALAAAFAEARERAATLAAQAGAALGPVISIAEEGEVTPQFSEDTAKSAPTACGATPVLSKRRRERCAGTAPVKPGRSSVTATIHVVFALQ